MNKLELLTCKQCGSAVTKTADHKFLCINCELQRLSLLIQVQARAEKIQKKPDAKVCRQCNLESTPVQIISSDEIDSLYSSSKRTCKICKTQFDNQNSNTRICVSCISKYSSSKVLNEKTQKALYRNNLSTIKTNPNKPNDWQKKFGFKSAYKEQLLNYVGTIEVEILPEIAAFKRMKLSNKFINPLRFA